MTTREKFPEITNYLESIEFALELNGAVKILQILEETIEPGVNLQDIKGILIDAIEFIENEF